MSFSPADSAIFSPLFSVPEVASIFSDERSVARFLDVEAALARVQERLGVIPQGAGGAIAESAEKLVIDLNRLQSSTEKVGLPVVNLVQQLREAVDEDAAPYVHWGATTQDVMDTALVLQLREALTWIECELVHLVENLAQMADHHRHTLMAGRTHSQQALPTTFGLKVANWLAPLVRHHQRLRELKPRVLVLQFGGAVGTLAALDKAGLAVVEKLATELELATPTLPWHAQRDNLVELAGWLSLVSGSLAKMAQDIILLAQSEVGEVRESADLSRGGSSTLPQKGNPVISETIIAAARTNASLLASMHQALPQEHERATHGWQMEWLVLPQIFGLTASTVQKALFLSDNLVVNEERMLQNIAASNGLMLAEAATFALSAHMPRTEAKNLVGNAVQIALSEERHLVDVVQELSNMSLAWETLRDERNYLGSAQQLIDRVLHTIQG